MFRTRSGAAAATLSLGVALALSCSPGGDLVVAPPSQVHSSFRVDIPPPRDDGRLPEGVVPTGYRLDLAIDPAAERFEGAVVIAIELDKPASAIVLHGAGLDIERAEVTSGDRRIRAETSYRKAAGTTRGEEELVLVTTSAVPPGAAEIHIAYRAPLGSALRGIYRVEEGGAPYVFTQFEPSDARRMFPGFDDPVYKVPFEIAVTVPSGNEVFANTPETARRETPDGRVRHEFAPSERMPSYLVALAIGPLDVLEGPRTPVPLRVIAPRGKAKLGKLALEIAAAELSLLSDYFAEPYPYAKLDLVAVPNFGPGAMENAGLITFREELLLLDGASASAKAKRDVALIVAHELAHQWFGNLVTMKWWDDLWLNEGFATFMEAQVVDRYRPDLGAGLEMLSLTGWVMDFDALPSARRVRQPVSNTYEAEEAFDGITYVKGASVIKMLNRWLGEDAFRAGVRQYLADHKWGGASAEDMFSALSRASGQDVAAVASTFLDQPGVPLVRARLVCAAGEAPRVELAQDRYRGRAGDGGAARWSIPVCLRYGGVKEGQACTLLSEAKATLALDEKRCPRWILPNADYAGYYRYALEPAGIDSLADAALAAAVADKVGFLSNLWALVQAGELSAEKLLEVLLRYKGERDRAVVEQVIKTIDHVGDALVEEQARPKFREMVAALLMPHARRLGWDLIPGEREEDRLLRRSVLEALAIHGDDPWIAAEAKKRAFAYLEKPGSIDTDAATIALRLAAHRGDITFAALEKALQAAKTPAERVAVVQGLGSLGQRDELEKALLLVQNGTIRAQDAIYVARTAVAWPVSRRVLLGWLREQLPALAERIPGFGLARMVATLRQICDANERQAAEAAFMPLVEKIGSARRLREALDHADMCIDLRARQAKAFTSHLSKKGKL